MLQVARKLKVAPLPKKRAADIGRCLNHCYEELGFSSAWDLAKFIDAQAERGPRRKKRPERVRLPAWKVPDGQGIRVVIAVRCKACSGTGQACRRCSGYAWGIIYRCAISKRASRCERHEAAPEPSPSSTTSAPSVSAAPTGQS